MTRTQRAAIQAAAVAFVLVAGTGLLLGLAAGPSLIAGAVSAAIGGALLLAAAGRAGTAHDDPSDQEA